ncbi:esterase [Penicillium capsulatum]|uniref:Esterase n=1 Tax=Penicillium capsulatum TaxID=69766 RepID=A0A9W9LHN1_9EURO|nr:esterase [Penicillium capsulatum]KAJ6106395.1 esterase [Penicillium capsulatum]
MAALWLGVGLAAGKSLAWTFWSFLSAPFRGETGGATVYKHVALTLARTFFSSASIEQLQYILPPKSARDAYESLMQSKRATPKIVTLPDGTSAFWIANPDAEKLMIYLPGGGYCIPALPAHFDFLDALATNLRTSGQDIGILVLAYDLAPHARWPRQLEQAVDLVQYSIETLGKKPSNIVLQGDSAGAHIVLALLSHIAHLHSCNSIPPLSLEETFRGVVLLSPWVDFEVNSESVRRNATKDALSPRFLRLWARALFGHSMPNNFSNPIQAPRGWWKDIPVDKIFIGAGGDEILLDSIIQIAHNIERDNSDVFVSVAPREFHAEHITDFGLKLPPGSQFQAMAAWLGQTLAC